MDTLRHVGGKTISIQRLSPASCQAMRKIGASVQLRFVIGGTK